MGADISSLDWHTPFRVDEKLTPEQEEEFVMNLEAANDLINNPEYLMEHIQRLFPDDEAVPIEMVRSISQSFIDRLRVHDESVLNKVGFIFQDVASNHRTGVTLSVLRGYLASILSILLTAALEEATRLNLKPKSNDEETVVGDDLLVSPHSRSKSIPEQVVAEESAVLRESIGPERYTIASSSHSCSSSINSWSSSNTDSTGMRIVNVPSTIPEETESELKKTLESLTASQKATINGGKYSKDLLNFEPENHAAKAHFGQEAPGADVASSEESKEVL